MLYHPPTGSTDPNAGYVGKNVAAGLQGSKVPPSAIEMTQRELVNLEVVAGLSPTDTDPYQVTRAVRGGQLDFATDTGTADALLIGFPLAHASLKAGLPFVIWKAASANATKVPTLTVTGPNGANPLTGTLVRRDGSALAPGDLPGGSFLQVRVDGAGSFRVLSMVASDVVGLILANAVVPATANVTLYVRPNGVDATADGSANTDAKAFGTIAAAVAYGTRRFSFAGFQLVIQLGAPGTYAAPGNVSAGGISITVQGDPANQAGYVISGAGPAGGGSALVAATNGTLSLVGVTVQNTSSINSNVAAVGAGTLSLQNVSLQTSVAGAPALVLVSSGGRASNVGGCVFGGAAATAITVNVGNFTMAGSIALANTPNYTSAFIAAGNSGSSFTLAGSYSFTGTGAAGPRYIVYANASLNTNGGGANFFPGTTAGSSSSGGQYL